MAVCENPARERGNLDALVRWIKVAPFNMASARAYGSVRLATRTRNTDHLDKLIAAHAIALDVVLITNNVRDFRAYPGLKIENWLET